MNIINYCKFINNKQIENIVNLLPEEYRELNVNIILLLNKWQILKYLNTSNILEKIGKILFHIPYDILGTCDYKNIFVCTYKFGMQYSNEYREFYMLKFIQTLIHEIRYQYQKKYMPYEYNKYITNKEYQKNVKHDDRWEEKDAYSFASKFMNDNYEKLISIIRGED